MDALTALRLQIEWGADEAIAEHPRDRLAAASPPAPHLVAEPPARPAPPTSNSAKPIAVRSQAQQIAAQAQSLEQLRRALEQFDACPLRQTATKLVFADGNPASGLMLVGEAPGAEEDLAGLPFVGTSGKLLDRMLASVGLDRSQYLITNLIPWRPPGNRPPTDAEVAQCLPFLIRHIELVRPKILVLLGALASQALTGRTDGIRRLRGHWLQLSFPGLPRPVPTLPMFHPAYLLRTNAAKLEAWSDLISLKVALTDI
jgi:DNA polymerase